MGPKPGGGRDSGASGRRGVPRGDGELDDGRQRDPDEVRDLRQGYPAVAVPRGGHDPDDGGPDDEDVGGGERQIAESGKDRHEEQIGGEIDRERQRDAGRGAAANDLNEDVTEGSNDDGIEDPPDEPDRGGGW